MCIKFLCFFVLVCIDTFKWKYLIILKWTFIVLFIHDIAGELFNLPIFYIFIHCAVSQDDVLFFFVFPTSWLDNNGVNILKGLMEIISQYH